MTFLLCGPGWCVHRPNVQNKGAGFGGMDRAPPARDSNGPASMVEREGRATGGTTSGGTACGGRCGLATTHLDILAPSIENAGANPAAFSCFVLIYDDLRQPIPAPGIVAIETAVANSRRCAVPQQSPWPAGAFSCDYMFWGERGGGLTRQPVGPFVDTAIMTAVLNTNRVDSRSFSSRGCASWLAHTSTDPIRLLCIRLALPLYSLPALTIRAQRKTHGRCFTSGPMACGVFFV